MFAQVDAAKAKNAVCVVFATWIAFVVVGLHLNGMLDDTVYPHLIDVTTPLKIAWRTIEGGSVLSFLAVVVGGLPIAWQVWRHAPAQRRWFWVPVIAFVVIAVPFAIALALFALNQAPSPGNGRGILIAWSYAAIFAIAAVASVWAVLTAVRRADIPAALSRFALGPAIVTVALMAIMTVATLVWSILASGQHVAGFSDVNPLTRSPVVGSLSLVVALMAAATLVGGVALLRAVIPGSRQAALA